MLKKIVIISILLTSVNFKIHASEPSDAESRRALQIIHASDEGKKVIEDLKLGNRNSALARIRDGADTNVKIEHGITALVVAIEKDDLELVKLLLEKGANPNEAFYMKACISDYYYQSCPLNLAIRKSSMNIVEELSKAGAQLAANDLFDDYTLSVEKLRILQKYNVNIRSINSGQIIFMLEEYSDPLEAVEILLKAGSSPDCMYRNHSETPLMWAATYDNVKMLELLMRYNADPEIKDRHGETALDLARRAGTHQKLYGYREQWRLKHQSKKASSSSVIAEDEEEN